MTYIKKFFLVLLGISLVLVELLGIALPVVHGTIFLLLGVVLLSFESVYIERHLLSFVEKHPTLRHWHKKIDTTLRRWFNK
ncbi:MAG: hypothetical protein KBC21_02565 [Candidatus Pacebacteria bacterium]|nr:hypothetical protein [Candidatus Paceibacterota bacterium]